MGGLPLKELEAAAARSTAGGDQMFDDSRWIHSYVLAETDGAPSERSASTRLAAGGGPRAAEAIFAADEAKHHKYQSVSGTNRGENGHETQTC